MIVSAGNSCLQSVILAYSVRQETHQAMAMFCCAAGAGTGHVLAVTECGQVWGWGSNECGQLGLGHVQQWVAVPAEITAALDGAWKVSLVLSYRVICCAPYCSEL